MSQQAVTELVIDADTSGADRFAAAMDKAAASTAGVSSGIGSTLLAIAGIGGGTIAAIAGVQGIVNQVVDANKELAGMQTLADRVGLSLKDLQGIKFGGAIAGLTDNQINSGLEKSAELLNDAQRNANSLSKIFDANGLSIKNANGQLISENQLLQTAADLIRKASTPQDQVAIAQMLGFTKEWIPLLEQGSTAIGGLGDEAKKAGALIDDATIQRASDFDAQWRKSSVEFSTYMKAALSGLLPIVDDLIQGAGKFIASIDKGKIQQHADQALAGLGEATGIPDAAGIKIDGESMKRAVQIFESSSAFSLDTWRQMGAAFSASIQLIGPEEIKWLQGVQAALHDTSPAALLSGASQQNFWDQEFGALKGMSADASGAGLSGATKIPSKDTGGDAVDRAINQLRKHTEQQLADAQAVGLGDAALASFRATAAETAAVQANGGKETEAQAQKFAELRDQAAGAADALARAKVASQIDFGNKTMLLSSDDVAIANQLKGIYGNDVPAALASSQAAALRLNTTFKSLSSAIENDVTNGLVDIVSGTKTASQGFADLAAAVEKSLEQMVIKMLIVEPIMRSLQSSLSGSGLLSFLTPGGSALPGTAGSSFFGPVAPSAFGNVFHGGQIIPFASGGLPDIASSPTIAPMALFGEAGPEAIMPLRRGADGSLGVASGGGSSPQVNVTLVENPNAQGTVSQQKNNNGGIDLEIAIAQISAKSAATPGGALNRVMVDQLGSQQRLARR